VDSTDDIVGGFDIDVELDDWLDKQAAEQGIDPQDMRATERDLIARWQQNPNADDFETLYNLHQPLIFGNPKSRGMIQSTNMPKNAVKSSLLRGYVNALKTYDPSRGAQFGTHFLGQWIGRTGRYLQRYSNVGRIPEERGGLIDLLQKRHADLQDQLGRPPTNDELSDDMLLAKQDIASLRDKKISPKIVGTLRKELRADWTAESAGGEVEGDADSKLRRQIVFLHGSLNPEQQAVLEHSFEEFGKPVSNDPNEVGQWTGMSPQKVRAIKAQIAKKVERFW
jgi:DNA-directed RNA polymerase specialized sigma subunit